MKNKPILLELGCGTGMGGLGFGIHGRDGERPLNFFYNKAVHIDILKSIKEIEEGDCVYIGIDSDLECEDYKEDVESFVRGRELNFIAGDYFTLPIKSSCIDMVYIGRFLPWENREDRDRVRNRKQLCNEIFRVMKPRGKIYLNYSYIDEITSDNRFEMIGSITTKAIEKERIAEKTRDMKTVSEWEVYQLNV